MDMNMKLSIFGSGLVGKAVGKVFARYGFEVIFYDKNRVVSTLRFGSFASEVCACNENATSNESSSHSIA